jgi:hypothetical protein
VILGVRLRLREGRRLTLGVAPSSRIVFALLFCLSLYVLLFGVLFEGEDSVLRAENAAAWLLAIANAAAALYEERWIFDRDRGVMEGRFGILFLYRRRVLPLREIGGIRLEQFRRGSAGEDGNAGSGKRPWRMIVRLAALDAHGSPIVLDSAGGLRVDELRRTGKRIGQYCGVPFLGS